MIIDYATQRRDNASQAVTAVSTRLSDAQTKLSSLSAQLTAQTESSVALDKSTADIRQKLSTIVTPADGETLLAELEQVIIRRRAVQSAMVDTQADIALAQADATQAQADLANASAALRSAEAALQDATEGNARRVALKAALGADPLKTIDAAATQALNLANNVKGANYKAAKKRVEDDIPEKLRTRATDRRDAVNTQITAAADSTKTATDAIVQKHKDNDSLSDQAGDFWLEFVAAEVATATYVNTAATRFDQAQKNLAAVGDKTNSPLTAEEIARINTSDVTLETARENAVTAEKGVTDKVAALETKQAEYEDAVVASEALPIDGPKAQAVVTKQGEVAAAQIVYNTDNDSWTSEQRDYAARILDVEIKQAALDDAIQKVIAAKGDPNTDPTLTAPRGNLSNAKLALKNAEDDYKASSHGILHAWEAAVPDSLWRLFEDFAQTEKTLTDLGAKTAAKISSDLTKAESDYVTAQIAADERTDVLAQLTAEQKTRAARAAGAVEAGALRRFSALRGDN